MSMKPREVFRRFWKNSVLRCRFDRRMGAAGKRRCGTRFIGTMERRGDRHPFTVIPHDLSIRFDWLGEMTALYASYGKPTFPEGLIIVYIPTVGCLQRDHTVDMYRGLSLFESRLATGGMVLVEDLGDADRMIPVPQG